MAAQTQTRHIKISVDTSGSRELKDIADKMGAITRSTKSLASGFGFLKNATIGYFSSIGVGRIVEISDEMQNLNNRLKILTGSQEGAAKALELLSQTASETKQPIADAAQVYSRLATTLKQSGASTEFLNDLTKTLINTFRVSGATPAETTAAMIQLSQAFSRGTLRGQELNSVLSQNAFLATELRKKYGKDLFASAEKGLITTAEVLKIVFDNQSKVNESAKTLTATIGQTLTAAFNSLSIAINNINQEFGIAGKFAKGIDFIQEKLAAITFVIGVLALTQIPRLIIAVGNLSVAMATFAAANPILAALTGITILIASTIDSFDDLRNLINSFIEPFYRLALVFKELEARFSVFIGTLLDAVGLLSKGDLSDIAKKVNEFKELKKKVDELNTPVKTKTNVLGGADENLKSEQDRIIDFYKKLLSGGGTGNIRDQLAELNKQFRDGKLDVREYGAELINFDLAKLNKEFEEGKVDLGKYSDRMRDIKILQFNQELQQGIISLSEYDAAISGVKIDALNQKLQLGVITLREYDMELAKVSDKFSASGSLRAGTQSYIESIGTTSNQVADAVKNAFGALENFLNNFIKTGKLNFKDFTQSILDDLQKIIIRATIVKPLAQGLLGSFGGGAAATSSGGSYSDFSSYAAKGMAYGPTGKITAFASGGIVSSPTAFTYGKSSLGMMGEAGPEAILPLSRGAGGDLGVKATVTPITINITNNANADVGTKETTGPNGERTIELIINSKVKDGIANGAFDKAFQQSYGLNRKGS